MKRRSFFATSALGVAAAVSDFGTTAWATAPVRFHVATDGDDSNSGLRPAEAWRSISRLNEALRDGTVASGNSVLFRRGDVFYGNIDARLKPRSSNSPPLVISSYGEGRRPTISGYKVVDSTESWVPYSDDVWRIDLVDGKSYRGNVANGSANTGFLRVDGKIHGAKRWSIDKLVEQWDFFSDETHLYVRSATNPSRVASDLRVAVDGTLVNGCSDLVIRGLELVGTGGHGYRQSDVTNTRISDCRIHEIGGATLKKTTRYGNGIELWLGSSNAYIADNEIFDVYDAAYTMQGRQSADSRRILDCTFTSNRIWNCTQTFEYWSMGVNDKDAGIIDCSFDHNVCINGGISWGRSVRDDKDGRGNFLMAYHQELPVDIKVENNLFFNARDCYLFVNTNGQRLRKGFVCDRNVIALKPDTPIQYGSSYTVEQSAEWAAESGHDRNSRWLTIPTSVVTGDDAIEYVFANLDRLRPD